MGLTKHSTGVYAVHGTFGREEGKSGVIKAALAGNPNVGKSTLFNALTGMDQHTGNWPGKTVTCASGYWKSRDAGCMLIDLPGCYSLLAHSEEEAVARDYICFGDADAVIAVCDACCIERSLNLALQIMEITPHVVICLNLMDEAQKSGVLPNAVLLQERLGVPVVPTCARSGLGLELLMQAVQDAATGKTGQTAVRVKYPPALERAIAGMQNALCPCMPENGPSLRWTALRLLEGDARMTQALAGHLGLAPHEAPAIEKAGKTAQNILKAAGLAQQTLHDEIIESIVHTAEDICRGAVSRAAASKTMRGYRIDRLLTGRRVGIPIMVLLLLFVFWLTIKGANLPSQLLSHALFALERTLHQAAAWMEMPAWLEGLLIDGMYRVLAWVVSVMLPPMAIFFPLFTLLEDLGYLPRVAFNLDHCLHRCSACGKQALTMAMGFGCNAAGVVGCRIIDSPRERLIAILTNSFVPCNGRFPMLISILTMLFAGTCGRFGTSMLSALLLTGLVLLGVLMTFAASRLLSKTVLKGMPSFFTLELPPYRRPQVGKVLVRSVFDRTLFVLGRAAAVAAPAGMIIWIMANTPFGDGTLLTQCAALLDPFARFFGLDGVILLAFILGFPANEIVVPLIVMGYLASGSIAEMASLEAMRTLFAENGWTWVTAVCTMLFSLLHWPCSTTCLTIYRETQSLKWTAAAFVLPAAAGFGLCAVVANGARLAQYLLAV